MCFVIFKLHICILFILDKLKDVKGTYIVKKTWQLQYAFEFSHLTTDTPQKNPLHASNVLDSDCCSLLFIHYLLLYLSTSNLAKSNAKEPLLLGTTPLG